MFRPKSKLRVPRWIIGTGRVYSGGLSVKHAAALAWQRAFDKQSSLLKAYFIYILCFKCILFFQNSILCQQNRMSYFPKTAVLSPILSTKHSSTTALDLWMLKYVYSGQKTADALPRLIEVATLGYRKLRWLWTSKEKKHYLFYNLFLLKFSNIIIICGAWSRYPYKVGDHKSPKSKKNTWEAELGHTAL